MAKGYKTICPQCGNDNFYVTPHNGLGYCFNCAYRQHDAGRGHCDNSKPFDIRAIRELYTELAAYYHSCLSSEHRAWLHNRGIDDYLIERLQIGYVPRSSHVLYLDPIAEDAGIATERRPWLADRIVFPYWFRHEVIDLRGRTIAHDEPKYLSPFNSAYRRGAVYPFNGDVMTAWPEMLVVTEGEIKALVSQQSGIATVAFPGIRAHRQLITSATQQIVICFDNQRDNYRDVYRAILDLAQKLYPYTQHLRVAVLPMRETDEKMDIDTFVLRYGEERYKSIIQSALPLSFYVTIAR